MATLEVHHGRNRVERVTISRDHPILFGSNPKCDIVIDGPGVMPYHGRLRWKSSGYYKVDASTDGEFVELNGRKVRSAPYKQGDEIQVGGCRIFMIHGEDGLQEESPAADPWTGQDSTARGSRARPAPPGPNAPPTVRRGRGPSPEALREASEIRPSETAPGVTPASPAVGDAPGLVRSGRRLLNVLTGRDRAPGQERIISSPLVLVLVGSLVALVFLGVTLQGIIAKTVATRLYNRAVESLDDGDHPKPTERDPRTSKARVFLALADVRQYTATTGASWSNALMASRKMVDTVGKERAYRDVSTELAELVIKTGEALADRARIAAEASLVAEAESALALHARVAGKAAGPMLTRSRLPAKLAEARAAVRKRQARERGLAAMDAALKAGSSSRVYDARDLLVASYPELAGDRDLTSRMARVNELIRKAVTLDPSRRPAVTEPRREPLGPPTSLVLRSADAGKLNPPSPAGEGIHAIADGFAYGLDAATGAPLWQVAVGLSSPFPPLAISGSEPSVLVFDSRHDELARLDARTGALLWRQGLGEPITDPPLVLGNQVLQATKRGKLLVIDLPSGEVRGTLDLHLPLTRTPVGDESGGFLYLLAESDCLFVVKRDPLECASVVYLGHAAGSLPCAPARIGRFLIVPENHAQASSRWRVFVTDEEGAGMRPVQQVDVPGWTWGTPAASGKVIWAVGDRGGASAFGIGTYDSKEPFRLIAKNQPEPKSSGPAYSLARTEREMWVASGRSGRLDLDVQRGTLKTAWTLAETGPALAPIQAAGSLQVYTHQDTEGPGVALWGVDPQSGTIRWRTVLGTPWTVSPLVAAGGAGLDTLSVDGQTLTIPHDRLSAGGFVESPLPRPGSFRLPPGPLARLEVDGVTVIIPSPTTEHLLVREGKGEFRKVELPAPLGAPPLVWGKDLFIPGGDGRAYRIDPRSGESRAEPFVPDYDRDKPTHWLAPALSEEDSVVLADDTGRVRRLTRPTDPRPRLVVSAEVNLDKGVSAAPVATGGAVILATGDGQIRALAARDLSPLGSWPLGAPLETPPSTIADRAFVADASGTVLAIGRDGARLWSIDLKEAVVGPPAVLGDSVYFLTRAGSLHRRQLADGSSLGRIPLDVVPAGGLRVIGPDLIVPVALGSLRSFTPKEGE